MSAHPLPRLTPEQYLEIERAAEFRSEYYDGRMVMMSGAPPNHVLITTNFIGELTRLLRKRPCRVYGVDLRFRISPDFYTYPDIAVVCGDLQFSDARKDSVVNPVLLIEVLSPSTERHDRGFKSKNYRAVKSVEEYAFVSQTEPLVEIYRRHRDAWLLTESAGLKSKCQFESVNCEVSLGEIYAKVDFA
jgi:Uma2 family endonuclease